MQWSLYFRNVVQCYKVIIVGWPEERVPFANLSSASSALSDLEMLLRKWEMGTIHWQEIDEDEFQKLCQEHNQRVEDGEINELKRCTRSDKGTKRLSASSENQGPNKKFKSVAIIEETSDEEDNHTSVNDMPTDRPNTDSEGASVTGTTSVPGGGVPDTTLPTNGNTSNQGTSMAGTATAASSSTSGANTTTNPGGSQGTSTAGTASTVNGSVSDANTATNPGNPMADLSSTQIDSMCEQLWNSISAFDPAVAEGTFFNETL